MFKTCDANTWRRQLPVTICTMYVLLINMYSRCYCLYTEQTHDYSKTCHIAVIIRSHCARKTALALKRSRHLSRAILTKEQSSKSCCITWRVHGQIIIIFWFKFPWCFMLMNNIGDDRQQGFIWNKNYPYISVIGPQYIIHSTYRLTYIIIYM